MSTLQKDSKESGLIAAIRVLFNDFTFSELLTTKIIEGIYKLEIVFAIIMAIGAFYLSHIFVNGDGDTLLQSIIALAVFFISVLVFRVYMEILIVIFRLSEDVREILKINKQDTNAHVKNKEGELE